MLEAERSYGTSVLGALELSQIHWCHPAILHDFFVFQIPSWNYSSLDVKFQKIKLINPQSNSVFSFYSRESLKLFELCSLL